MKSSMLKGMSNADFKSAQEMKFNNDFVYQTNQSLQGLSRSIETLSLLHEATHAKLESRLKDTEIFLENLSQNVIEKINYFSHKIGDFETRNLLVKDHLDKKLDEFSKSYLTLEAHMKSTFMTLSAHDNLNNKVDRSNSCLKSDFSGLQEKLNSQMNEIRKEIPSVEEFKPLRKEMECAFQSFKVDFQGLVREIALLKKSLDYDQKKFENVYTLIERLKEGKS